MLLRSQTRHLCMRSEQVTGSRFGLLGLLILWALCLHFSLRRYAGTVLPGGEMVAAPSSLNGMLSHLSTTFALLDRTGPWKEDARMGNPIDSEAIARFKKGYARKVAEAGFEEGSAVAWTESEVWTLIHGLDREALECSLAGGEHCAAGRLEKAWEAYSRYLLLDRDALLCSYLWWGMQRGREAGRLTVGDLSTPLGTPAYPLPFPPPAGYRVGLPDAMLA